MRKIRFTFGIKLCMAIAGIVLIVSLSIYMLVVKVFEDKMRETRFYQLEEQMEQTVDKVNFYLDQLRSIYVNMTADFMLIETFAEGYNRSINPRLQYPIRKMDTLSALYNWVHTIYIYDPNSSLFFDSNSLATTQLLDDIWLQNAMEDKGMYHFVVLENSRNPYDSPYNLSVGGPIRKNFTEEPVAYFSIQVKLDTLKEQIFPPSYSEGTLYAMYDSEGSHLFGDMQDWELHKELPPASQVSYHNQRYIQFTQTSPEYDWTFLILTPESEMYAGINQIRRVTIPFVVIALFIGLLIAIYLSWRFTRPITLLTRAVYDYRSNEKNADTIINLERNDEFQILNDGLIEMAGRINHLIVDVYQSRLQKKEMELKMLYRSMDPHFIYNVLDSINWQVTLGKSKEASRALIALSRYLRGTMFEQGQWTDLEKTREEIEAYNQLQEIFYSEKIHCHVDFPSELLQLRIPSMILQPIIENCYTHGYPEEYRGSPFIDITARMKQGFLEIQIADNGVGIDKDYLTTLRKRLEDESSLNIHERNTDFFALRNVQSRIQIQCGAEWGLTVQSNEGGTTVIVRLPLWMSENKEEKL